MTRRPARQRVSCSWACCPGGRQRDPLLEAGACGVWRDTGHLYADLDHALEIASLAAAASH